MLKVSIFNIGYYEITKISTFQSYSFLFLLSLMLFCGSLIYQEPGENKGKKQKKCNDANNDEEKKLKVDKNNQAKAEEEPPRGYIHVRARRGQATDSHSLAERVLIQTRSQTSIKLKWNFNKF